MGNVQQVPTLHLRPQASEYPAIIVWNRIHEIRRLNLKDIMSDKPSITTAKPNPQANFFLGKIE